MSINPIILASAALIAVMMVVSVTLDDVHAQQGGGGVEFTSHGGGSHIEVNLTEGGAGADISFKLTAPPGREYEPHISFPMFQSHYNDDRNRISCYMPGDENHWYRGTRDMKGVFDANYGNRLMVRQSINGVHTPILIEPIDHPNYCNSKRIIFNDSNWNTPQTLHIKAGHDVDTRNHSYTLTFSDPVIHRGSDRETGYYLRGTLPTITVNITDDNTRKLYASSTQTSITEGETLTLNVSILPPLADGVMVTVPYFIHHGVDPSSDFIHADDRGHKTIQFGKNGGTIQVRTVDDSVSEAHDSIQVDFTASVYVQGVTTWIASVNDNDGGGHSPIPPPAVSLSISGNGAEGEDVTFGIESVPPPLTPLDVTISLDQTGGILADSNTGQRTITIPTAGFASFTIPTIDDGIVDDNTITITILDGDGYTVGVPSSNTITIPDNDVATDSLIGLSDSVQEPETPQPETPEQPSFTADPTLIANIKEYAAETYRGQEHVDRWHRVLKTLGVEEFPGLTTMTSGEAYTFVQQGWNRWIPVVAELKAFETWQQQPQPEQPQQPPQQQPIPVNLVSNSSFEAPIVTAHNGQWQQFAPSTAGISWTVTGDSLEIQRGILGGASDGSQHAELDAQGSVTISQTLSTVSGQAYEISFDYKARPNTASNTNGMNVTWNGVDIAPNLTLGNTWQTYTVNVTGTGSDTISFADAGTSDGIGTFLDNVSVMRTGSPPQ